MFLTVSAFWLLANNAGVNNGQIIYSSPPPPSVIYSPPPPSSVPCETCENCENPCTPAVPASPPPPFAASPPPPGAVQSGCPSPPNTDGYPFPPPAPFSPCLRFPFYPFYSISRSAPLLNPVFALFFLLSPLILILTLWFAPYSVLEGFGIIMWRVNVCSIFQLIAVGWSIWQFADPPFLKQLKQNNRMNVWIDGATSICYFMLYLAEFLAHFTFNVMDIAKVAAFTLYYLYFTDLHKCSSRLYYLTDLRKCSSGCGLCWAHCNSLYITTFSCMAGFVIAF